MTWWNGQTIGTQIYTSRHGVKVGEDEQGNIYYQTRDARRWVIYNGEAEASRGGLAWLAAPHLGRTADQGAAEAQAVGEAA